MLERLYYEAASGNYAAAFSTATSPTQLYTIEGPDKQIIQHTRERVLGIAQDLLAPGEDASYISHDGLRVSARLYLPAAGAWLRRAMAGHFLHPRRSPGPGTAGFCLVFDAVDPVLHAERLRGLCAQCARQYRLRAGLYEAGGPRLGRAGSPGPCCRVREACAGSPAGYGAGRGDGTLVWRLHDPDPGRKTPGALESRLRHVRPIQHVHLPRTVAGDLADLFLPRRGPPRARS